MYASRTYGYVLFFIPRVVKWSWMALEGTSFTFGSRSFYRFLRLSRALMARMRDAVALMIAAIPKRIPAIPASSISFSSFHTPIIHSYICMCQAGSAHSSNFSTILSSRRHAILLCARFHTMIWLFIMVVSAWSRSAVAC